MGFEAIEVGVVEAFDDGFLDGLVYPLSLTVCPRMVWLGKPVLDAVLVADAVEDVGAEVSPGRTVAVLRQIGEGHAVVG